MDFTGALYVKQNNEEVKVYVCLFTCATSRAVHLEVVTDLTTATFLLAFHRFAAQRSLPIESYDHTMAEYKYNIGSLLHNTVLLFIVLCVKLSHI